MASRELSILVTAKNLASRVLGQVKGDVKGLNTVGSQMRSNLGRNLAISSAIAGFSLQVRAGVDSLVELERVNGLTAAALESTGNVAGQSTEGIRARAEAMEQMSGVDDKVIQNAENLLLTFKGVRQDAFEPTLEAALNLNAALGGGDEGLQGVMIQVGKAMNDPVQGMTALRRSGVSFTKAQIAQVKALVDSNDLMGAQAIILGELESQFGGAAEAANQGAGKAQRQWTDAVEDIQKSLATGFLPLIGRVSEKMSSLVADPAFMQGVESFGESLAGGFDKALDLVESIDWGTVASAFSTMGTGAKLAMDAFLSAPPWLQTAILTGWGLNKLTGGALGSLIGLVGQGIIKGVMSMNAGVVNINAATVNGGGGGLPGVGGAAGGGLRGAINGGGLIGGLATGTALAAPVLAGVAAVEIVNFENMRTEAISGLETVLDSMPHRTGAEIDASIAKIQGEINAERPLLEGIIFNTHVRPQLEAQITELQQQRAAAAQQSRTHAAAVKAGAYSQINEFRRGSNERRSEANAARAKADAVKAAVFAGRDATNRGFTAANANLGVIARKNMSPIIKNNVTVPVTVSTSVFVSASQVMQQVRRVQSATGGFSGFQEGTL